MSPTEAEKGLTLVLNISVSMFPTSEEGQPKLVSLIFPFLLLLLLYIPNSYLASNLQRLGAHFSKRFRKPIRFSLDTKRGPVFHPHLTILQRPPGCRWCSQWHQWAAWHKSDPHSPCRHIPAGIHLPSHPLSGKPWKIKKKEEKKGWSSKIELCYATPGTSAADGMRNISVPEDFWAVFGFKGTLAKLKPQQGSRMLSDL